MKYLFTILLLVVSFSLITKAQEDYQKKEIKSNIEDLFSFELADSMYSVSDTATFDKFAEKLLSKISSNIDKGIKIENQIIWDDLLKLEPYRLDKRVQNFIDKISKTIGARIKKQLKSAPVTDINQLKQISKSYKEKLFVENIVRDFLQKNPYNLDIRNNLALAQLHLNKDLIAQLEFQILTQISGNYTPAFINLITVYERLGMRKAAENIAIDFSKIDEYNIIPQIVFNAAWYYNLRGEYAIADSLLAMLLKLDVGKTKYESFYELNKKQLLYPELLKKREKYDNANIFEVGLLNKFHFLETITGWIISIIAFIIATIIIWGLGKHLGKWGAFFLALIFYFLIWGLPYFRFEWKFIPEWIAIFLFLIFSLIFSASSKKS